MKDPLELNKNPYDLLEISVNSNTAQIKDARKAALPKARGQENIAKINTAFNILSVPQERAFADLFLYYEPFLNQLIPRINGAEAQLEDKRIEIAKAWSNIQIRSYPNFAATHSLALLWYMWALYNEEENLKGKKLPSAPSLTQLWSNAISHWVFLMCSTKFMNEWIESKKTEWIESEKIVSKDPKNIDIDSKKLVEDLEIEFNKKFEHFIEGYQKNKDTDSVKRIQEYKTIFQSEKNAAEKLLKVYDEGLQFTRNGSPITVCCGPIMLENLGMLDSIRTQIDDFIKIDPQNTTLKQMRNKLSPFANIYTLLDNKKYDEVLKVIESLPPNDKKAKEILSIQAKVCLERGKQETQNRNYKKSSEYLKRGLDTGELESELIESIVANCMAEVNSLSDLDSKIKVLEAALKIIIDSRLNELLSEKYTDRGVSRINEAYKKLESSKKTSQDKDNAKSEIEKGIKDLKNAVKINPSNKRANESLENAKSLLEGIEEAEAVILNARGLELANEATKLQNEAITFKKPELLFEALNKLKEAERVLTEAHNKAPSNKIIESNLGQIRVELEHIIDLERVDPSFEAIMKITPPPGKRGFLSKLCSTVDTLLMALFFYPGLGIVLASFAQLVYSIGLQGAFLIGFTSEYSGTNRIEYIQGIFFGFLLIIASLILSYGNLKNAESRPNSPVRAVIKYVLVFCLCLAALYVVHPPWISQFN
jgi:hypothetical protein